ncbi:hypothetical protein D0Z07_4374 [Hyphodiscus hymeniophilus]|uniref:Uncharacterized protein n=1 Tax=Hyphodiscus hymeniophilus TaxID=353542 RepID=A0A9P7AXJ4_9HELO|nr:hypothetical protein D0Z07_4374 [Hyphodiscus hymeniophilus]
MRAFLKACLLLAPALATAIDAPTTVVDFGVHEGLSDHALTRIDVEITSTYDNSKEVIPFHLDVFPSEQACGFGNVTIDGQALAQVQNGDSSRDGGSITTQGNNFIIGSWEFRCIKVNGQPDSQLMIFTVDFLDGKPTLANGFTALFRQTGAPKILSIGTDLTIPGEVLANPDAVVLRPAGGHEDEDFTQISIEQEMDELHWLRAQQRELQFLIWAKERAIAEHVSAHFNEDIKDCSSLKCVAEAVVDKARKAAHHMINKIHGHHDRYQHEHRGSKAEHLKESGHGRYGNHTCGHSKHGNHAGPPHWKEPHHRQLPICQYPPPPKHGGPHGDVPHGGPDHDTRPHEGAHPHEGPHGPPEFQGGAHPNDGPHGPEESEAETPGNLFESELSQHGRPDHPFPGPGPHHHVPGRAFHIAKFVTIGVLISLLVITIHRRCNSSKRADRRSRREERHRRRALRQTAYTHAFTRFLASLSGNDSEDRDYEEKRQVLLARAEDGMSTSLTEEISELRNAAEVVDDMVAESRRRSHQISILTPPAAAVSEGRTGPSERDYEIGSQVGDGEELPAYGDSDGSEMSSVVANGFRYTPGSREYSPAHSSAGSVSDILGPDVKH